MRALFLFISFFILTAINAQNIEFNEMCTVEFDRVDTTSISNDGSILVYFYSQDSIVRIEKWADGVMINNNSFKNGVVSGTNKGYFSDGSLKEYYEIVDDEMQLSIEFHNNGNIRLVSVLDSITDTRIVKSYYKCGALKSRSLTNGQNKATEVIDYYENGNLLSKSIMNGGKQKFQAFYENGVLMEDYTFVNNTLNLVGEFRLYYPNGQLEVLKKFEDANTQELANRPIGTWKYWDEAGNLIDQVIHKSDNEAIRIPN